MDTQVTKVSAASRGKASKKEAVDAAMKGCLEQGAKQCEIISWYANGCVALAVSESSIGVASRNTIPEAEAEAAAMVQCRDATCRINCSKCSRLSS